jgi:hypothetical protein
MTLVKDGCFRPEAGIQPGKGWGRFSAKATHTPDFSQYLSTVISERLKPARS